MIAFLLIYVKIYKFYIKKMAPLESRAMREENRSPSLHFSEILMARNATKPIPKTELSVASPGHPKRWSSSSISMTTPMPNRTITETSISFFISSASFLRWFVLSSYYIKYPILSRGAFSLIFYGRLWQTCGFHRGFAG